MDTKVIRVDSSKPDAAVIAEAATVIDAGGLAAFPTETVYGIACRVRDDSLARLSNLKGRTAEKYYTLHIGRKDCLSRYVPSLDARAEKLVGRTWPGPLTIVFELSQKDIGKQRALLENEVFKNLYKYNSLGVRCPDNVVAAMLLDAAKEAVVAPSANLAGQSPAIEAGQVIERFDGLVDLVLDGGRCRYGKSSTVVKIGENGPQVLREGVYIQDEIQNMSMLNFLFVCTGNTCRSPIAEGLFAKYLSQKLGCSVDGVEEKGYKISSAGTMGGVGWPATAEAVEACARRGVDIAGHRSTALSAELVAEADYVFVMSQAHRQRVLGLNVEFKGKSILMLGEEEIPDPIGQGQEVYDKCAEMIEKAVKTRICEIVK